MFQSRRKLFQEREGDFRFFPKVSVSFYIVLAVLLCLCAVLCFLFFRTYTISKEQIKYPTWGMYVRAATASDAKRMWRPSCFLLKHGGGTLGIIKSPVCNYDP